MKFSTNMTGGLMIAATLALGSVAMAQEGTVDPSGLNLPADLQILGKADPNIRKPTAIINKVVITGTDVDQRLSMVLALNEVTNIGGDELQRLRVQVLRQLIDETLQIDAAKRLEVAPSKEDVDNSVNRIVTGMKRNPTEMAEFLRSKGSSYASFRRQIEGEVSWQRVQRRRIDINVSDEEVNTILERLKATQGAEEFHVKEIYLESTPETQGQVAANAQRIIEEIRKQSRPFEYFASNFSAATTRAVGGDLGWVRAPQLPETLAMNVAQMQPGQIAGPIDVGGGFSILWLVERRKALTADPRDARVDLRQLTIDFAPGTSRAQATAKATEFGAAVKEIRGCGDVDAIARRIGAKVVTSDSNRIKDLPGPLQEVMLNMQIGQATPPFGSLDQGVRALILCGRDEVRSAGLPDPNRLRQAVEEDRTNRVANRMLRDLRRDAIIEYK